MSQTETAKAEASEERTEENRSFVRRVRTAARRKYTSEEKIRIVLEGFRREVTVSDLCGREGIKPHSYYGLCTKGRIRKQLLIQPPDFWFRRHFWCKAPFRWSISCSSTWA